MPQCHYTDLPKNMSHQVLNILSERLRLVACKVNFLSKRWEYNQSQLMCYLYMKKWYEQMCFLQLWNKSCTCCAGVCALYNTCNEVTYLHSFKMVLRNHMHSSYAYKHGRKKQSKKWVNLTGILHGHSLNLHPRSVTNIVDVKVLGCHQLDSPIEVVQWNGHTQALPLGFRQYAPVVFIPLHLEKVKQKHVILLNFVSVTYGALWW